ncbi:aromatic prenyltransferase [Streptomyces sp. NPDC014724]|uniref:aromatic prenyltransferase n=1 Tax=unclassified Streptomyces TaxID=2593676 RepID=UPI0036F79DB9
MPPDRLRQIIHEIRRGVGTAPFYSESATRQVLDIYGRSFREGAVLWRTTDKPGGALNYRFYERKQTDTVGTAVRGGLLSADNRAADLISAWSSLYRGSSTELCDFDAARGLVKTWVYLGGLRPMEEILGNPGVPRSIHRHEGLFRDLGLKSVRHVAVDYQHDTANLYFRTAKAITPDECERLLSLVKSGLPEAAVFDDMANFTAPNGFTFSVTMSIDTGEVERIAFYALKLPAGRFPRVGERLTAFFASAPSYDDEEMNAVAWSFGKGNNYIKAERSYCGRLVPLMREWNSPMTDPTRTL